MSDVPSMTEGWHVGREGGPQTGPYTWEQLAAYAHEGRVAPTDLVWHPSLTDWTAARNIPDLFPQVTPQKPRKSSSAAIAAILVIAFLSAIGGGAWWLLGRDGGDGVLDDLVGSGSTPDLGVAEVILPDDASLIETADWGEVPTNQIGITLLDGYERDDAEAVATSLSGTIVGEVEYIAMYQIQFPGTTEADLVAALDTAAVAEGVEFAFPNQQTELDEEIWGVRVNTYNDPVYGGGAGDGYEAVGVSRAWTFIKGAGIELSDVHVGIVDDGLYREGEGRENEFGGDVKINFPDETSGELDAAKTRKDGTPNAAGSHGTGVATIIGADPDNGGPSGIAGPLGSNLQISMLNKYSGSYGNTTSTPDPNDPAKVNWSNGRTYSLGSLVALNKQIAAGATIINCSWGNANASPQLASAYKKYFEKMSQDHPDVLFVCSGGNTGTALDGSRRLPSGLALPNMITVGAIDNDGTLADYSSKSSDNYEVTLAAPGTNAVVGQKDDGSAERQNGTSFSAPHVAAAAAILRSIDPDLSAGDIKRILVETARPGITVGDTSNLAPPEVGGRILAIDQAVLKVINDKRAKANLPALEAEDLEKLGAIDAVAVTGGPGEYTIRGIIEAAGEGGTDIRIAVSAENSAIGGSTTQSLSGAGEVQWSVTLFEDEGIVTVTRLDSGAKSVITIEKLDINGAWSGTFTITGINVTDEEAAEEDGCSVMLIEQLVGTAFPASMDITADESGIGSAVFVVNAGEDSGDPQNLTIRYAKGAITFEGMEDTNSMTATVSRQGTALLMTGKIAGGGDGWTYTATFSLTKPE